MFARMVDIVGAIFWLLLVFLFLALGHPVDNLIRKLFKVNDKCSFVIQLILFTLIARKVALWIGPIVETVIIDPLVDLLIDLLV